MTNAKNIVTTMIEYLECRESTTNIGLNAGDELAVIINNLQGMTELEMLIIANNIHSILG